MPWSETTIMDARVAFILDWKSQKHQMTELCARYGVSRKTAYKWVNRFMEEGPDGLWERSHAPSRSPHRTSEEVEQAIVQQRLRHPSWGPKKLIWTLERWRPELELPSRTTVAEILKRNDLVLAKKRPRAVGHPGRPSMAVNEAQRQLEHGLQGAVQDRRREVPVPADGDGQPQPLPAGVPGTARHTAGAHQGRADQGVQGARTASAPEKRQRRAVRGVQPGQTEPAVGVAAEAGQSCRS